MRRESALNYFKKVFACRAASERLRLMADRCSAAAVVDFITTGVVIEVFCGLIMEQVPPLSVFTPPPPLPFYLLPPFWK